MNLIKKNKIKITTDADVLILRYSMKHIIKILTSVKKVVINIVFTTITFLHVVQHVSQKPQRKCVQDY